MLPREVRCRFFQERILHLQLADAALQLPAPLIVWHIGRQRLPREFLPVCLNPEPERGIVDIEFPRHLGDRSRRRGVDHFLDGLLLELRSVMLRFPRHLIPSFPVRILLDPLSGKSGAPQGFRGSPAAWTEALLWAASGTTRELTSKEAHKFRRLDQP